MEVKSLSVRTQEDVCTIEAQLIAGSGVDLEAHVAQIGERDDVTEVDVVG
jgi:hypothetical protein